MVARTLATPGVDVNQQDEVCLQSTTHTLRHAGTLAQSQLMLDEQEGRTALYWAAGHGHLRVVNQLLDATGIDPALPETTAGHTPLMHAASKGQHRIVHRLLELHACAPSQRSKARVTALMLAAENGDPECVRALLYSAPPAHVNLVDVVSTVAAVAAVAVASCDHDMCWWWRCTLTGRS